MKHLLLVLSFLSGSALYASEGSYTLTVKANNFKNDKGEVQFSLYNKNGTIPDKQLNLYFLKKRVKVKNGHAEATFKDLPKGKYAVSFYHDENNNNKIDKGLVMPEEGVGLSNFKTINFFNLPNFKAARFMLNKNMKKEIKVIYF